jgi:DNA-binding response OmpR family regulator
LPPDPGRPPSILPPRAAWRADLQALPIDGEDAAVVLEDGERRRLSPQEQATLAPLLLCRIASHDRLYSALWGLWLEPPDTFATGLRVAIYSLRRKLAGSGAVILTLATVGYRLEVAANDNRPANGHAA